MARIIGIRHRIKKTAEGESRPTQVCILGADGAVVETYDLKNEEAELAFSLGQLPRGKQLDGFVTGDIIAMALGGSGDCLAFALSRRGEEINAKVLRLPPYRLNDARGEADKSEDARLLAELAFCQPDLFTEVSPRDRHIILVRESLRARQEVMEARVGCEQRLRQRVIGAAFTKIGGLFEEGMIERAYDAEKANDNVLENLILEEGRRQRELERALVGLDVYEEVLKPVEGLGPLIAARLIAAVGNIGRFATEAKFKAFCGVHVLPDGRFPRRRRNELSNWNPVARQALFLLADQFNRRPDSHWGQVLRRYKLELRARHPEEIGENGKKRYTDGHIHKMAIWRTLTKFVEWLFREWKTLDAQRSP